MSGPSHTLLQISPYYEDLDGEYRGGGVEEREEGNEGGDASVEWYSKVEKIIIQ